MGSLGTVVRGAVLAWSYATSCRPCLAARSSNSNSTSEMMLSVRGAPRVDLSVARVGLIVGYVIKFLKSFYISI